LAFSVEDLALTALVRILPRNRYRLAALTDSRFQSFASNTTRIAYRQQGATPAFLLFSGPNQNPHAAAMAAAGWAEANWRPNAIQRRVRPGVVVVHVAPGNQLTPAGPVAGAAVPAAVWTVDSATGRVATAGKPPGSPSGGEIRHAANSLMRGVPAPSLGELDLAEKGVMQLRTATMPRYVSAFLGLFLLYFTLRYGLGGVLGLFILPELLQGNVVGDQLLVAVSFGAYVAMLAGIVLGAALLFNFQNAAARLPGFSSAASAVRNATWVGYFAAMIGLVVVIESVVPALMHHAASGATPQTDYKNVTVKVHDDGGVTYVATGGVLTVDLSGWPSAEWSGVQFKTSNPTVLSLESSPANGGKPVAKFSAAAEGNARVDASSADGKYTFQIRVLVGPTPPTD
jgi:hypothetical protein